MNWIIPSPQWSAEMRLIMDVFGLCMNDAFKVLKEYGTAEAAFNAMT
jgi:hypothetical protein